MNKVKLEEFITILDSEIEASKYTSGQVFYLGLLHTRELYKDWIKENMKKEYAEKTCGNCANKNNCNIYMVEDCDAIDLWEPINSIKISPCQTCANVDRCTNANKIECNGGKLWEAVEDDGN